MTCTKRNCNRSGFTLIELLVVIAIIGVLVFLLLPAVNSAREAARRMQCTSNMRQVAMAVVNYESNFGRLPPAGHVSKNIRANATFGEFNPRRGRMISWMVLVLPYLEQQSLYREFDIEKSILAQPRNPQEKHVDTYNCPSDTAHELFFQHDELTRGVKFGKSNYAAYVSPMHTDLLREYPGALGGGKWVDNKERWLQSEGRYAKLDKMVGQQLTAVTDGTSRTVMLSEVRTRDEETDQRGVWALPWTGSSLLAFDMHPDPDSPFFYEAWDLSFESAQTPNHIAVNFDMIYDCAAPRESDFEGMPCSSWEQDGLTGESSNYYLSAAPRSNHQGGVVIANMDASVAFLSNAVDPQAMSYLISANDNLKSADTVRDLTD